MLVNKNDLDVESVFYFAAEGASNIDHLLFFVVFIIRNTYNNNIWWMFVDDLVNLLPICRAIFVVPDGLDTARFIGQTIRYCNTGSFSANIETEVCFNTH